MVIITKICITIITMKELKLHPIITARDTDSINRYLAEIAKIPLLGIDEEVKLAIKAKAGDTVALERLVNANLRFVVSVAKNYQHRGLSLGDLINEGNVGLIKAALKFDPTKGFKFISFAVWWIRQTIILAISEQTRTIRLPLNIINSISNINKASSVLEQRLERLPTHEEIASEVSLSVSKVNDHLHRARKTLFLDSTLNSDTDTTVLVTVPDDGAAPDLHFTRSDGFSELTYMLRKVSRRERLVLQLHFGLFGQMPMSLEEIGRKLNLSKERIRQIRDLGIKKLRERIQMNSFKP
jgi:RNA polymerase primary sigma factor